MTEPLHHSIGVVKNNAPAMVTADDRIDELVDSIKSYSALSKRMSEDVSPRWVNRIHENLYEQLCALERLEREISGECIAIEAQRSELTFYERFFRDSEERSTAAQYHRQLKRINAAITGGYHLLDSF